MNTYISILRGINVSGHRKIAMSDLKDLYEDLQFKAVTTYIQSGNVIFKAAESAAKGDLPKKIEKAILEAYGFEVPVIIRTIAEIEQIIAKNPFLPDSNTDLEKLHITFLSAMPDEEKLKSIATVDFSPDKFIINNREVFLYIPGGYGNTKLSNNFFEGKMKVTATTRNWKTVNKLLELAITL
ncbi:MAG: DUF1697 domain-containing protein [Bacteroidota bacterium]|nr:DUF1697 domain-containing protein [Bacteroidota bacterium]